MKDMLLWICNQSWIRKLNCLLAVVVIFGCIDTVGSANNLSCYQCVRHKHEECDAAELLPCDAKYDRCYTHIMKDEDDGFKIERQCGIGPCTFDDLMMEKTIGIGPNSCDRGRHNYFCLFCCRENGCNKNNSIKYVSNKTISTFLLILSIFIIL